MAAQDDRKKWCICQVHEPGFPDAPYYTPLAQYGPWDNERDARQISELLARLENQEYALAVRQCIDEPMRVAARDIDSTTAVDQNPLPD